MSVDLSPYILRVMSINRLTAIQKAEVYNDIRTNVWEKYPGLSYENIINQILKFIDEDDIGKQYRKVLAKKIFINFIDKYRKEKESLEYIFEFFYKEKGVSRIND